MSNEVLPGNLIVVTAPSGAGKTTLCHAVCKRLGGAIRFSVSHTTRPPRSDEVDGVAYHFVGHDEFQRMADASELIEWAEIHNNYYGTSRAQIEAPLARGIDIFLDIEGQGAMQIREKNPAAVLVFILPPDEETLRRRLAGRGTDSAEEIDRRCENARREIAFAEQFDYVIVNDYLDDAVAALEAVVRAARQRLENMRNAVARYTPTP